MSHCCLYASISAQGATLLHTAASQGRADAVRALMRCGADPMQTFLVRAVRSWLLYFLIAVARSNRQVSSSIWSSSLEGTAPLLTMHRSSMHPQDVPTRSRHLINAVHAAARRG